MTAGIYGISTLLCVISEFKCLEVGFNGFRRNGGFYGFNPDFLVNAEVGYCRTEKHDVCTFCRACLKGK